MISDQKNHTRIYNHVILKDFECLTTYFFHFFYKTQKFHSHIALKQNNNHSNSTVLTKGAALPLFVFGHWGTWPIN